MGRKEAVASSSPADFVAVAKLVTHHRPNLDLVILVVRRACAQSFVVMKLMKGKRCRIPIYFQRSVV